MAQTNLITKADIQIYFDLSSTIADADVDRFIMNAQRSNLKYWIGDDLYYNLVENKSDGGKYQALLDGYAYEHTSGKFRYFDGIKPLLVWEAVRLMMIEFKNKSTKVGFVEQKKRNSDNQTAENIEKQIGYARSQAFQYHSQLVDYMAVNSVNFSEYTGIKKMQTLIF